MVYWEAAARGGGRGVKGQEEAVANRVEVGEALCASFASRYDD